ncbi:MAG TPA: WG repeat-containing protein [Chitinophagaceae bacterium]|nr:WG repeat-containing protein [Chitinophagaceae bacterium]
MYPVAPVMKKIVCLLLLCACRSLAWGQTSPVLIPYLQDELWGYCDTGGTVRIRPQWRNVGFFHKGRAIVNTKDATCIIDTNGAYIIPPYRHWTGHFYPSLIGAYFNALGKEGKYGIIDSNNRELLPCLYDRTEFGNTFLMSGGHFSWDKRQGTYTATAVKNGKYGIIDTQNRVLIPFVYDGIEHSKYSGNTPYYRVKKGEQYGLLNRQGRVLIPPVYRNLWTDPNNENQFMVFRERTTAIADSTGRIVLEIPGYTLGFPGHSVVPVEDSMGLHGLMDNKGNVLIPCTYLGLWLQHDTMVVSRWGTDTAGKQVQEFRYHDVATLKEQSSWLSYAQFTHLPAPQPVETLHRHLPHYIEMRIQGRLWKEYPKDSMAWTATGYPWQPESLMPVQGIGPADTLPHYVAILDTNGSYAAGPFRTDKRLRVINSTDSLLLLETEGREPLRTVTDFHLQTIMPQQEYAIVDAFYRQGIFYALVRHEQKYRTYWRNFEGGGSGEAIAYSYYLVGADGQAAKGMAGYKLLGYTDSNGGPKSAGYFEYLGRDEGFAGPFTGYFLAEDSLGNQGVIDLYGRVQVTAVSFRYKRMNAAGPDVFLVDARDAEEETLFTSLLLKKTSKPEADLKGKEQRGYPYLVNRQNEVLLDSLSVDYAGLVRDQDYPDIYNVGLKSRHGDKQGYGIDFYINSRGKAYYSGIPADRRNGLPQKGKKKY